MRAFTHLPRCPERRKSVRNPYSYLRIRVPDTFYDTVRVFGLTGDPSDGHAIATRPANGAVIVHRKHVLDLRAGESFVSERSRYTDVPGWVRLRSSDCPRVGPSYALSTARTGSARPGEGLAEGGDALESTMRLGRIMETKAWGAHGRVEGRTQ